MKYRVLVYPFLIALLCLLTGNSYASEGRAVASKPEVSITEGTAEDASTAAQEEDRPDGSFPDMSEEEIKELFQKAYDGLMGKAEEGNESEVEAVIEEQIRYLAQTQVAIELVHKQMKEIAAIRRDLFSQILQELNLDSPIANVDENGNVIIQDAVFWETNRADIKPEGAEILNRLISVLSEFLSDDDRTKYIDRIMISGHTDSDGSDEMNRVLSTQRTTALVSYLLDDTKLSPFKQYFCAAGFGESRPIASNETKEGKAMNRRIEISVVLNDEAVMDAVHHYLQIAVPDIS